MRDPFCPLQATFFIMSYSGGGTLTLPSPTHTHHVDVTSAVRTIRRSLSRSPSKFRFVTSRSGSSSPVSAQSPSPKSSNTPLDDNSNSQSAPSHTPSPLARPFPPSVKLSLRSSTRPKMTSPRASYGRTSPKSPLKRALSETSDSGNSTRRSSKESLGGPGSSKGSTSSPPLRMSLDTDRESSQMESFGPINQVLARFTEENHDPSNLSGISSPLKRNDAIMNLDQASLGSPVAKRRSLHASASLGHEFSVFDQGNVPSTFDIHDDGNHEYELSPISFTAGNPALVNALGAMPRRSSSLRKSTLQQRHGDKQTSWGRKHAAQLEAAKMNSIEFPSDLSTPIASKNRPRLSLDQFLPPPPRDSPFSNQGSLPNPSAHMIPPPPERQAHPLSRTMTQSSSNSSICVEDESPTHVPVHFRDHPRPRIDFSKSLPAGALRPQMLAAIAREEGDSFSTPPNYKAVKPLPAAFMSTGLISKVNRFPEEPQPVHGAKGQMPDTPCKKQNNVFATYPQPVPGSAIAKARHIRHSFGTPSTPFNPNGSSKTKSIFSKRNVFGSSFGQAGLSRRGSFLSTDGDDLGSSPLADEKQDCLMTGDDDFPPTPTKQATTSIGSTDEPASIKPLSLRGLPSSTSVIGMDLLSGDVSNSSKSNLLTLDGNKYDSTSTIPRGDPATPSGFRMSSRASSSFHRSRTSRGSSMFLPMSLHSTPPSHSYTLPAIKLSQAKIGLPAPASPLDRVDFTQGSSPITPQAPCSNDMLPPDPSRLSISNTKDEQAKRLFSDKGSTRPPATPTAGRESFSQFGERRLSVTPINNSFSPDLDDALLSRFDKVELIGNGEFSTVYKVSAPSTNTSSRNTMLQFAPTGSPLAEKSLTPVAGHEQVFAVKKARQAYQGVRDRGRKLREVEVLKALNNHDHIVHFIDHWEARDHLYIQTEYCEEGSLDTFLSQVGRKGRLDDFRIWKIMLETSQVRRTATLRINSLTL